MSELSGKAVALKVQEIMVPLNKEVSLLMPREPGECDAKYAGRCLDRLDEAMQEMAECLAELKGFISGVLLGQD